MAAARPRRIADPNTSVMHLLHRAGQEANLRLAKELARHEVTPRQFVVLLAIAGSPGCRQTDLEADTGVDRSTVAGIAARLETRGLIERAAAEGDGRAKQVRLTPAGTRLLRRCRQGAALVEEELLASLAAAERRRLRAALVAVARIRTDV